MKKTVLYSIGAAILCGVLFSSCTKKASDAKIPVTFAGTEAATTGQSRMMQAVADKLNETGRFNATVQVAGALSGDTDALVTQAKLGISLVVPSDPGRLASQFKIPDLNILMAPYILTDPAALKKLPDTALFKEWQAELEKQGIVYITNMYNGFRCFYTTTPVKHVSDLSGLRIRGFGNSIGNNLARYLGFANIGISWGEVFPGIQSKTLDGCEVQVATADGARLYEVVKNLAMTKHYMLQSAFVCSSAFYNSMSPADRELFTKIMRDAAVEYGEIIAGEEKGFYDNMRKNGVTITDVDIAEFQKAIEPLYTNNDLGFSAGLKDRLFSELK
ncbi:TRAP transporter substrate-binding protein DctP [Treponema saccharophilum]|uniref:TRAP transporter substrate-binding protein DctP n=1 Tax=Treponema saccharophilum TaxID=165 RepID=UPI0038684C04